MDIAQVVLLGPFKLEINVSGQVEVLLQPGDGLCGRDLLTLLKLYGCREFTWLTLVDVTGSLQDGSGSVAVEFLKVAALLALAQQGQCQGAKQAEDAGPAS